MPEDNSIRVYIRNQAGQYLALASEGWTFVAEPSQAHVFDYHADAIFEQLVATQREFGVSWIAWPLDPSLARETCDVCGKQVFPTAAIFDGARFLCCNCHHGFGT